MPAAIATKNVTTVAGVVTDFVVKMYVTLVI